MKKIALIASAFMLISTVAIVKAGGGKVVVCHNGNEIEISENALEAHLAHGDVIGGCKTGDDDSQWSATTSSSTTTTTTTMTASVTKGE